MSKIKSPVPLDYHLDLNDLSLDYHLDLDVESLWREFDDIPTLPHSLAAGHGFPRHQSSKSPSADSPSLISCFYHSTYEDEFSCSWPGPDPLAPDTRTDDIFRYMSAFLLDEQMHWVDFRLCRLSKETGEFIEQYPFFLPRTESIAGNVARIREQVQDIICRHNATGWGRSSFQLHMCPRHEEVPESITHGIESQSIHSANLLILDPQFFVQNISANFR